MKAHIYRMTCLTNLHVGNGDVNYSIIDNQVERDPVSQEPVIPSSGVKGALLSFVKENYKGKVSEIEDVFGGESEEVKGNKKTKKGKYKFLSAGLLARPVRVSKGEPSYLLATTSEILNDFMNLAKDLGEPVSINSIPSPGLNGVSDKISVEGIHLTRTENNKDIVDLLNNNNWAVLGSEQLRGISLPVAARNSLDEKGISKNLWYEEYVPHKSVFYMIILTPDEKNLLDNELNINGKVVQFGADASVGYGLMKIEKINRK